MGLTLTPEKFGCPPGLKKIKLWKNHCMGVIGNPPFFCNAKILDLPDSWGDVGLHKCIKRKILFSICWGSHWMDDNFHSNFMTGICWSLSKQSSKGSKGWLKKCNKGSDRGWFMGMLWYLKIRLETRTLWRRWGLHSGSPYLGMYFKNRRRQNPLSLSQNHLWP